MKNKKAFTLVELLAVIAILGVLLALVLPKISGSINERKEKEYEIIIKSIENSAKAYFAENNEATSVDIITLVNEKYLSSDIKNPITNTTITGCVNLGTDLDGSRTYTFTTTCD